MMFLKVIKGNIEINDTSQIIIITLLLLSCNKYQISDLIYITYELLLVVFVFYGTSWFWDPWWLPDGD